jgi:hypothetical protein
LAKPLITAGGDGISGYSVDSEDCKERRLFRRSPKRALKEQATLSLRMKRYEEKLKRLNVCSLQPQGDRNVERH